MNKFEAGDPVQEARIDFTYESGVAIHADGAHETVYCIRNDGSIPVWVKWHGPKPGLLLESLVPGGGRRAKRHNKRYETTQPDDRMIEYGLSRRYGKQTTGKTLTFEALLDAPKPTLVQATPLDLVGVSMAEALADADTLDRYLESYRSSPQGGNELAIWSYASNWIPADGGVLAQLAAGEEIEDYDGSYVPVSYGLRSTIDIDKRVATSSVQFWFGHFNVNDEAFALAVGSEIRGRLSLVTTAGPFPGLADFKGESTYGLAEAEAFLGRDVGNADVGGSNTVQLVPWTIGLAFDGVPLSALQAELFEN
ncbi:hypothetical protein [Hoeflea sp. YIM 152468]|uniref:hypothetical protein n=1 Tax=Hoeflea sp. YIM 152468 TaxID=3031759 RepID=UPI0023DB0586|nr:hypothetical protein [Hoeflea sp. YIM 152468]